MNNSRLIMEKERDGKKIIVMKFKEGDYDRECFCCREPKKIEYEILNFWRNELLPPLITDEICAKCYDYVFEVNMKKYIWQRVGKDKIEKEKLVDLNANRKTLLFVRKKMLVKVEDVQKKFGITRESAINRLRTLKKTGYLSQRKHNGKSIYFCTKKGFSQMPRKKIHKPLVVEKIKEIEKEITKLDKTNYLGEI